MAIKEALKTGPLTRGLYAKYKISRDRRRLEQRAVLKGEFENRSRSCETVCIVLAGYKDFVYPSTLERIYAFAGDGIDVCVASPGLYSRDLSSICRGYGWSYLSTERNNVCLAQNVAISLFPAADSIFKIDEDIFVTEGFFEGLELAYEHAPSIGYDVGVVSPLLPINGYGHVRVLDRLGLVGTYESLFGCLPVYAAGYTRPIESNAAVARFFWGEGGYVPTIDEMAKRFSAEALDVRPVPIRLSIGAIYFKRELWEAMVGFDASSKGNDMGKDERQLCTYCMLKSRPLMVCENVVAGHLAFGAQNAAMQEYFLAHPERFARPNGG